MHCIIYWLRVFQQTVETHKLPVNIITRALLVIQQRALDFEKLAQMKVGAKSFVLANWDLRPKMRPKISTKLILLIVVGCIFVL